MAEFINTIDVLGDDAVIDSIIDRSITEFKDDTLTTIGIYAFNGCTSLETVEMPNVTTIGNSSFYQCSSLKTVEMPNLSAVGSWAFSCAGTADSEVCFPMALKLENDTFRSSYFKCIDLPVCTQVGDRVFAGTKNLVALILRSNTICTALSSGIFNADYGTASAVASGTGYIYVPKALLSDDDETSDYRRATNWSVFAAQFRALEDYTVDGTITGKLDKTKI